MVKKEKGGRNVICRIFGLEHLYWVKMWLNCVLTCRIRRSVLTFSAPMPGSWTIITSLGPLVSSCVVMVHDITRLVPFILSLFI